MSALLQYNGKAVCTPTTAPRSRFPKAGRMSTAKIQYLGVLRHRLGKRSPPDASARRQSGRSCQRQH